MPAKRKSKKQAQAENLARAEELKQARRDMCSWLKFWKYCGHKKCLHVRGCADDAFDCFDRFWPIVPERIKVCIRAAGKAHQAKLPRPEVKAHIERELARWDAFVASEEARQAATQAAAEPAPQSTAIVPAPSPRLRVL